MGSAHPSVAPYQLFEAADGELVVAVGTDLQFARLCGVLGAPELADSDDFATNAARVRNRARLASALGERLRERAASDWVSELSAAGVPAGRVNDIAGAFALAESLGLGPIVEIPRERGGAARLTRNPLRLSVTPPRYRLAPPPLPDPAGAE